jgi:hypothetical protein
MLKRTEHKSNGCCSVGSMPTPSDALARFWCGYPYLRFSKGFHYMKLLDEADFFSFRTAAT